MKKIIFILIAIMVAGCNGVIVNAKFSEELDKNAAWCAAVGEQIDKELVELQKPDKTKADAIAVLKDARTLWANQCERWELFRLARDGKKAPVPVPKDGE